MIIYSIATGLTAILVFLLIRAEFAENKKQIYLLKPLSTIFVIGIACLSFIMSNNYNLFYSIFIILALIFSLGGDIALMFTSKKAFIIGLILFLLAHIVYTFIFTYFNHLHKSDLLTGILLLILAGSIYYYLYSGLDKMKLPVLIYILVISFMMQRSVSVFWSSFFNMGQMFLISIGAGLFIISDIMLAVNKFKKPLRNHRISLLFYYSGQMLFALSAGLF